MVRGYEAIKLRNVDLFRERAEELLAGLAAAPDAESQPLRWSQSTHSTPVSAR